MCFNQIIVKGKIAKISKKIAEFLKLENSAFELQHLSGWKF